jgi:ribosomal protein S18 acetylase RimI-like enzyme
MNLTAISALHYSSEQLSAFLGECFEGYSIPFSLPPERFALRFGAEDISLPDSCVWMNEDMPVAVAIIARRAESARLAAFALRPAWRGMGMGKKLLEPLVQGMRAKGVRQMWLEVLADNEAGAGLYRSLGFETKQILRGYQGDACSGAGDNLLREINPLELVWRSVAEVKNTLPWLIDPLSVVTLPCRVFEYRKHAYAAISTLTETHQLRFLYVEPEYRRKGFAREMLMTLNHHFPGLTTSVAVPESFTPLFTSAGYSVMELSQFEMRAVL